MQYTMTAAVLLLASFSIVVTVFIVSAIIAASCPAPAHYRSIEQVVPKKEKKRNRSRPIKEGVTSGLVPIPSH